MYVYVHLICNVTWQEEALLLNDLSTDFKNFQNLHERFSLEFPDGELLSRNCIRQSTEQLKEPSQRVDDATGHALQLPNSQTIRTIYPFL